MSLGYLILRVPFKLRIVTFCLLFVSACFLNRRWNFHLLAFRMLARLLLSMQLLWVAAALQFWLNLEIKPWNSISVITVIALMALFWHYIDVWFFCLPADWGLQWGHDSNCVYLALLFDWILNCCIFDDCEHVCLCNWNIILGVKRRLGSTWEKWLREMSQ